MLLGTCSPQRAQRIAFVTPRYAFGSGALVISTETFGRRRVLDQSSYTLRPLTRMVG